MVAVLARDSRIARVRVPRQWVSLSIVTITCRPVSPVDWRIPTPSSLHFCRTPPTSGVAATRSPLLDRPKQAILQQQKKYTIPNPNRLHIFCFFFTSPSHCRHLADVTYVYGVTSGFYVKRTQRYTVQNAFLEQETYLRHTTHF